MPERSVVVTAELQRAMVADFSRMVVRQPATFVPCILIPVFACCIAAGVELPRGGSAGLAVVAAPVVGLVVAAVILLLTVRRVASTLRVTMPAASTVTADLDDAGLSLATPRGTARSLWAVYRSIAVRGSVVVLRHRGTRVASVLPSALFDEAELRLMRDRIAESG